MPHISLPECLKMIQFSQLYIYKIMTKSLGTTQELSDSLTLELPAWLDLAKRLSTADQ